MLLIQRIVTNWTKRSRGGDAAVLRNSVAEALEVPEFDLLDGCYVVHDVSFSEGNDYVANGRLRYCELKTDVTIAPLRLHLSRTSVSARFVWTYRDVGAPERESHAVFQLHSGQWGQFRCNGRFGAETKTGREWEYRKSVINVAFAEAIPHDIFVASVPDAEHARLAMLR